MISTLLTLLATALSLLVVDLAVPGVDIATFPVALIAAASIGLVNSFVKPAISLLSLPLNFVTLGAFSLIINGLCFWLASVLVPAFRVDCLLAFLLGPVILSFVNTLINKYFSERNVDFKTEA